MLVLGHNLLVYKKVLNFMQFKLTEETDFEAPTVNVTDDRRILTDIQISPNSVRKKLSLLKPNKASGPDTINVNVLRKCPNLDVPLSILFNKSLQTGYVPQDWKDANVTPLHKKGPKTHCKNYRPVSLTSQIAKLLERLVFDEISKTLSVNNFISCNQHGFQERCSCITQLLDSLHDWTLNYDSSKATDIIYLDFAKAFDKVSHRRLL